MCQLAEWDRHVSAIPLFPPVNNPPKYPKTNPKKMAIAEPGILDLNNFFETMLEPRVKSPTHRNPTIRPFLSITFSNSSIWLLLKAF